MSDAEYVSFQQSKSTTVDARYALEAWEKCVQAQQNGLFAAITEGPNYDYFQVRMLYRTEGGNSYTIQGLNTQSGITCNANGKALNTPYKVETSTFAFACNKPADRQTVLSMNTSEGAPIPIPINGTKLSEADLRKLQQDVETLKGDAATLKGDAATLQSNIDNKQLDVVDGPTVHAGQNAPGQSSLTGNCPSGYTVISYYCQVDSGGGVLQNIGINSGSSSAACGLTRRPLQMEHLRHLATPFACVLNNNSI